MTIRNHLHRRSPIVLSAVLGIGFIAWLAHSHWSRSQEVRPNAEKTALQKTLEKLTPPQNDYTVQDGTLIRSRRTDGAGKPAPAAAKSKVDAIDLDAAYERAQRLFAQARGRTFKTRIEPHWFDDNTQFWYRNELRRGAREFVVVNAKSGKRGPAFDHQKLAAALSKETKSKYQSSRLPFDSIEFIGGNKAVRFKVRGTTWQCDLTSYHCTSTKRDSEKNTDNKPNNKRPPETVDEDQSVDDDTPPQQRGRGFGRGRGRGGRGRGGRSPNGRWTATVKDYNLFARGPDGKESQLTKNGVETKSYGYLSWSPNSKTLVAYRRTPSDSKEVYMIETSPRDQLHTKLHKRIYPRAGDKFATYELWLFDMEKRTPTKVDIEAIDFGRPSRLRWNKGGTHFTFEKTDRGHQRFRIVEVDAQSGKTRNIIDEKAKTFIWTAHSPGRGMIPGIYVRYLDRSNEILYVSQRDGWKHMYLVDGKTGKFKHQITKGEWVVRAIDRVDEDKRQIWFRASGKNSDHDPYLMQYYRVNFDGSGLVALTEGDGNHTIQYSPNRRFIIDTYSRVDMAPVHELRRVSDGSLVCKIDEADISALLDTGWRPPEVFVGKGRDGKTDIWGIVCRPQNFDKNKKYPVIEYIYAGPHNSHVPKSFRSYYSMQALAELGFIVVQIDGMGTANRSRAFHDVCWKNIADAGFPDRILWMKALAKKYAYVDISRVGIYGTSAGGQNALGALLFHPEFYKVAVAACGCHDNRLDKASWNEQWMGIMGPHYKAQSNVTNAHKLQGKLLLIVGEMDTNVPFESTMRVVDALVKSRKDFDLLVVPGMGHSSGGSYGQRRLRDFFVRHLHGIEPPDRNRREP